MTWLIASMAVLVFVCRGFFIFTAHKIKLPEGMRVALSFAPPVVLSVIVVSSVMNIAKSSGNALETAAAFVALAIAGGVVYRFGSFSAAIVSSLGFYLVMKLVFL
ncbi:MAG: AzlD domain-containing protein [Xanthomonadales bacterium]|nr:AzlD domain-containing protein [Xanthomonadales bacterium]